MFASNYRLNLDKELIKETLVKSRDFIIETSPFTPHINIYVDNYQTYYNLDSEFKTSYFGGTTGPYLGQNFFINNLQAYTDYPNGYTVYINMYSEYSGGQDIVLENIYKKQRKVFYLKSTSSSLQSSTITPFESSASEKKTTITLQPYENCWLVIV